MALSERHQRQVDGLVNDTISPALSEDFEFKSKEQAEAVLAELKSQVNNIDVDSFYFE